MARPKKRARKKVVRRMIRVPATELVRIPISIGADCRTMTAARLCRYLEALQPWLTQVSTCLQNAGLCGGGGKVPADPPPWPPA